MREIDQRMKNKVIAVLLLIGLIALDTICFLPADAQYQGDITINSDGSITPSTAPIQKTGNTYSLTSALNGQKIMVNRNNTILDGQGSTVWGLRLDGVSNVTVKRFVVTGGYHYGGSPKGLSAGIYLSSTSDALITNNTIREVYDFVAAFGNYEPVAAIVVTGGYSNNFSSNILLSNFRGMYFQSSEYNLITENTIVSTIAVQKEHGSDNPAGIFFFHASNNIVYHNTFKIERLESTGDYYYDTVNIWDDGFPSGGNYWGDYSAGEIGDSGIGDRPYTIDAHNTDRYPLLEPFNSTFTASKLTPPTVSLEASVNGLSVGLVFAADEALNWSGYTLDGQANVTSGNTTLTGLSTGVHCIKVYANDSYGNMGASEAVIFEVLEPFSLAAVVGASVVVGAVVAAVVAVLLKRRR